MSPAQAMALTLTHPAAACAQDLQETAKTSSQAGAGNRCEKAAGAPRCRKTQVVFSNIRSYDSAAARAD